MDIKTATLLNNFLTSGLATSDLERLRRIKVLNLFESAFVFLSPFLGLFYFYVGAFLLFYVIVIAGLMGVAILLLLRALKDPRIVGNAAILVLWAVVMLVRWNGGGISENGLFFLVWIWNGALILMAIFLTGYLWGTVWACIVFLESGYAVHLHRSGYAFANLIPSDIASIYCLGAYLLGLLVILIFAFLFEKERDEVRMRECDKTRMLTDSKNYIQDVLQSLPVPTFVLDKHHRVVHWNRACRDLTGIGSAEIVGKRVWEGLAVNEEGSVADQLLSNPDKFNQIFADSMVSRTESGAFAVDAMLPKIKGGMRAIINTAPIVDQTGEIKGAIQTIQDKGNETRREEPEGDQAVGGLLNAAFAAFQVDAGGKVNAWNKACEERYGYEAAEMIGKSPVVLLSKAYRKNFRDAIVEVFKGEPVKGKEWKYKTREGKPLYVLADLYPLRNKQGKIDACLVINPDITGIKLRLKKLGRYAAEVKEEAKRLKEEHDLLKSNIASFIRHRDDET